jgi:hypothetical protein
LFLGLLLALYTFNNVWAEDVDMMKIITIESGGNPHAFNKRTHAIGLCQITPICLREYNHRDRRLSYIDDEGNKCWCVIYPDEWFTHNYDIGDLYNPNTNLLIGTWYMNERIPKLLKHYHIEDTIENRLRAYNSGIGTLVKGRYPQETRDYVKKYFAR